MSIVLSNTLERLLICFWQKLVIHFIHCRCELYPSDVLEPNGLFWSAGCVANGKVTDTQ